MTLADPLKSAAIMGIFALGTVPALFSLGVTASFTKAAWYPWFTRIISVLIIFISLQYIVSAAVLYEITPFGFSANKYVVEKGETIVENGMQVLKMDVLANKYSPNTYEVKKNIPVKWVVNGKNVYGCQGFLSVPKLGIQKTLRPGINIIEFTPRKSETIHFSCSSQSVQGSIRII